MRWVDTYFPFTNPSFELEIYFKVCLSTLFSIHVMLTCISCLVKTDISDAHILHSLFFKECTLFEYRN